MRSRTQACALSVALLLGAICTDANAAWTARGPDGGFIRAVDSNAGKLRIGTTDGIYESVDAGATWLRLGDLLRGVWIWDVAASPADSAILLAAGSDQLYRSVDGGVHWTGTGEWLLHVVFDPAAPNRVFAIDPNQVNLHLSDNAGATWRTTTLPGGTALTAAGIAADPIQANTFYVSTTSGDIYRSTDHGSTWTRLVTSRTGTPFDLSPDPFDSSILLWADNNLDVGHALRFQHGGSAASTVVYSDYASTMLADPHTNGRFWYVGSLDALDTLFESTDHGASFAAIAPIPGSLLGADPLVSGLLYGTDALGFAVSSDAGRSWQSRTRGVPLAETNSVSIHPGSGSEILAAGEAYGVAISVDGGLSWQPSNTGLTQRNAKTLARSPLDPLVVYAGTSDGLFRSADGGRSWNPVAVTSFPWSGRREFLRLAIDSVNPALLTAMLGHSTVAWSDDAGASWRTATTSDGAYDLRAIPHANTGTRRVYALKWQSSIDYALYRAPSHGGTFSPTMGNLRLSAIAVHPTDDGTLIAFARDGQWAHWNVYRSGDGGDHWELRGSLPLPGLGYEPQLNFDPCNPQTIYALAGTSFYVSPDQGITWSEDPIAVPSTVFNELDARCSHGVVSLAAATKYAGAQVRASTAVDAIFSNGFEKN